MASFALGIGNNNNGFLGGPTYPGPGTPQNEFELVASNSGVQVNASLAPGAMPYDPGSGLFGSLRIGSPQPVSGIGGVFSGSGGLLLLILILWAVFK